MTAEQIWLLKYGRGWVPWYEVVDGMPGSINVDPVYERLVADGRIEVQEQKMLLRLKPKEENEPIRV